MIGGGLAGPEAAVAGLPPPPAGAPAERAASWSMPRTLSRTECQFMGGDYPDSLVQRLAIRAHRQQDRAPATRPPKSSAKCG